MRVAVAPDAFAPSETRPGSFILKQGWRGGKEMLTQDKLMRALKQANETANSTLAQGCTTDRGIAALDAQRAVQEADEYLAAGDMLEAYGLFCFASGKLYDNHAHWKERFRWLYLEGSKI